MTVVKEQLANHVTADIEGEDVPQQLGMKVALALSLAHHGLKDGRKWMGVKHGCVLWYNVWRVRISTGYLPGQNPSLSTFVRIFKAPYHWLNKDKMSEYIELIFVSYVNSKHRELKLPLSDQPALVLLHISKSQQAQSIINLLEENNMLVVNIPVNCTDRLQPVDPDH